MDLNDFIKSIERRYKIDFKTLPQWKQLIKKLNFVEMDYSRKLHEVKLRKLFIVNKLYTENMRRTPFELTEKLARTANFWHKSRLTSRQTSENQTLNTKKDVHPVPSIQDSKDSVRKNNDPLSEQEALLHELVFMDVDKDTNNLPLIISNQHKLLSPLNSQDSDLSYHTLESISLHKKTKTNQTECHFVHFNGVKCDPKKIIIRDSTSEEQTIEFTLKNISNDCCKVMFENIVNPRFFMNAKVFPPVTIKLYPGLSFVFNFNFNLLQNKVDFSTDLFFRILSKVSKGAQLSRLCIPICTKFFDPISLSVSNVVYIPPVYKWHLNSKFGYPSGIITIEVKNDNECYFRLINRKKDLARDPSHTSVDTVANSESVIDRIEDDNLINDTSTWSTTKLLANKNYNDAEKINNFIKFIINDIIEASLDTFLFDLRCNHLPPKSIKKIKVTFHKSEHTGFHQTYCDIEFRCIDNGEIIETRTVKIFAEVLPHPLKISPVILDMSNSPVVHGMYKDHFVLTNTHKIYCVKIQIKPLAIMRKLLTITPMTITILPESSIKFQVTMCSSDNASELDDEVKDMVHFTFKIIATGVKSIYDGIPPIYYEIIAPCALQFHEAKKNKVNVKI
ncbi:unnamed protein product [Parnassius apollo]|uniref:(apollo) hypothetical protein n=1 Tax=Parnassius apollo TaxID=110799 RepID=A0A8S3Y1G8_PARAO|nr:unnamed protein product [Parnassius apollo]